MFRNNSDDLSEITGNVYFYRMFKQINCTILFIAFLIIPGWYNQKTYRILIANMPSIVTQQQFSEITAYSGIVEDYTQTFKSLKNNHLTSGFPRTRVSLDYTRNTSPATPIILMPL